MDSLTHIALGACIGEAFIGRSIGKKALLWGAVAQSLPDIDVVASLWLGTAENLLAHRGFTHSLLFALLLTPFLALLADKLHRPHNVRIQRWMWFFATELLTHLFLDGLNAYGTGWLEPFSHYRFSLNTIFVVDPIFSLLPGIACVALVLLKARERRRKAWYKLGIAGSVVYLVFCMTNKIRVERDVRNILQAERITCNQYMTTPTPFNNLLCMWWLAEIAATL
jgi:inner membrane protein